MALPVLCFLMTEEWLTRGVGDSCSDLHKKESMPYWMGLHVCLVVFFLILSQTCREAAGDSLCDSTCAKSTMKSNNHRGSTLIMGLRPLSLRVWPLLLQDDRVFLLSSEYTNKVSLGKQRTSLDTYMSGLCCLELREISLLFISYSVPGVLL